jgi:UDP-glucuronate 4-epimerase
MSEQPKRGLVTGAAGFIGSRLCKTLVDRGWQVVGIDRFTDYYARSTKEANIEELRGRQAFRFVEGDVANLTAEGDLANVDVVFHQAAQAGVRGSWGDGFASYVQHNIIATQRLLEESRRSGIERFVYASSSSVYGNAARYPTRETDLTRPHSPYGVTKLAAENLVSAYAHNFGMSTVSLRYHTVYGPGQRPDMAIHRLICGALEGKAFELFAAGDFVRDFTYVDDICNANVQAASAVIPPGTVLNLAGGESISMHGLIGLVGQIVGRPVPVEERDGQPGDVRRTDADWSAAQKTLGWSPTTPLVEGLGAQVKWHRSRRSGT